MAVLWMFLGLMLMTANNPDTTRGVARDEMVTAQIEAREIADRRVLEAMRTVPRHRFVPSEYAHRAYADEPLPIGLEQTISQPYIVALMTELAAIDSADTVLEIGTGSGYQAAVLAQIAAHVYTIEILAPLAARADSTLRTLGYDNISVKAGDGYRGWPEHAPFDAILVTAAPDHIPAPLIEQLKVGGRLIIPVGERWQELMLVTKDASGAQTRSVTPVRFVPMTGEAQDRDKD